MLRGADRRPDRTADRRAGALADARRGQHLVALGVGRMDGLQPGPAGALPDRDRAAVPASSTSPTKALPVQALMTRCGFCREGLYVMDGSRRTAWPTRTRTSPASARPNGSSSSTPARQAVAGRSRAVLAPRTGPLQAAPRGQAGCGDVRAEPGRLRPSSGGCRGRPGSISGLGVRPTWARPTTRSRCCCSRSRCRCSGTSSRRSSR